MFYLLATVNSDVVYKYGCIFNELTLFPLVLRPTVELKNYSIVPVFFLKSFCKNFCTVIFMYSFILQSKVYEGSLFSISIIFNLYYNSQSYGGEVLSCVVLICFSLVIYYTNIFKKCACWPLVCLFLRYVCLGLMICVRMAPIGASVWKLAPQLVELFGKD